MNEQNLKYIANLKAQDVPWSRLTTAYGRASEVPKIFEKLVRAIEACDAPRGSGGEQNLKSGAEILRRISAMKECFNRAIAAKFNRAARANPRVNLSACVNRKISLKF